MDLYGILHFAHVLCVVYWVGASVGVLGLALALKNPAYSYDSAAC